MLLPRGSSHPGATKSSLLLGYSLPSQPPGSLTIKLYCNLFKEPYIVFPLVGRSQQSTSTTGFPNCKYSVNPFKELQQVRKTYNLPDKLYQVSCLGSHFFFLIKKNVLTPNVNSQDLFPCILGSSSITSQLAAL